MIRRFPLKIKATWKKWLSHELPAIMFSLVLAVLLWYFNQIRLTEERSFQIEPTLKISDQMIPLKDPKTFTVKVKGDSNVLRNVDPNDFSIVVDLSNATGEGEHEAIISLERSGIAKHLKGLEVSFSPLSMRLTLEKKVTKQVPVKVNTRGSVKAGYEVEIGVPAPDTITITGPRSEMENLQCIETEVINMEELTKGIEPDTRSTTLDQSVSLLPLKEGSSSFIYNRKQEILYSFRVQEVIKQVSVQNLYLNQIGTLPEFNYHFSTDHAELRLSGPELLLNKLNVDDLTLAVELDEIEAAGVYTLPIIRMFSSESINLMQRITDLGLFPAEVTVTVTRK